MVIKCGSIVVYRLTPLHHNEQQCCETYKIFGRDSKISFDILVFPPLDVKSVNKKHISNNGSACLVWKVKAESEVA